MQQYFGKSKKDNTIYLFEYDLNHIKNVMRMKENTEIIVVFDNISYICSLNKDYLSADIKSIFKQYECTTPIVAYIPFLNDEKMSYIFQKGTELGVTDYIVVMYSNCKYKLNKKDYEKKLTRWSKILKEASEQCYRIHKPTLEKIIEVKDITLLTNVNILCSLDKRNVNRLFQVLTTNNCCDTISIAFGPEGGLSESEEEILVNKGFTKTSLGDNVLRSETVILYISSIIKYLRERD